MTAYRDPPAHCLPRKRRLLPWWRHIVLGRKARIWYDSMIANDPDAEIAHRLRKIERRLKRRMESLQRSTDRMLAVIDEFKR